VSEATKIYGEFKSERAATENEVCRQMVQEIIHFEVSERQKLFLIYLLALELDDPESLKIITSVVRDLEQTNPFLKGESLLMMAKDD